MVANDPLQVRFSGIVAEALGRQAVRGVLDRELEFLV